MCEEVLENENMENGKVCHFWLWDEYESNCMVMVNFRWYDSAIEYKTPGLIAGDRLCGNCRCRSSIKPNCNEVTGDCFHCEEDSECMNQSNGKNKCSKTNGLCIKGLYVKVKIGLVAAAIFDF